jgi:hypothetical protein
MEQTQQRSGIEWKWVIAGVIAGMFIVGSSYYIVAPTFHSPEIQALIVMVGFSITGVIVGYFSPGVTIREGGIAGGLVMLLMILLLWLGGFEHDQMVNSVTIDILLLLLGVGFALVGSWAGEKLQEASESTSDEAKADDVFHWRWVLTGVVIGFALNVLFVFLSAPLFNVNLNAALVAFLVSFLITGFIVGYKSPGVTLKEPAVAGIFTVIIDWVILEFVINLTIAADDLVAGLAFGFLFALLGAWLGEKYQEAQHQNKAS